MKTKPSRMLLAVLLVAGMASNAAAILFLGPANADWTGDDVAALTPAQVATEAKSECELMLSYKMNVGGSAEGLYADSYTTEFFNTPTDPDAFVLTWNSSEDTISNARYLLVKDGNQEPAWYLFDITTIWDGQQEIQGLGFWPNEGAISHVSLYSCTSVADGGATLVLLGLSALAFSAARRKMTA